MAILWDWAAHLWTLSRKIEDIVKLQDTTKEALEVVNSRLQALETRMTHFEANQTGLITEAKAAAGAAATGLAGSILSDVVTRITRIELRQEAARRSLPGPE